MTHSDWPGLRTCLQGIITRVDSKGVSAMLRGHDVTQTLSFNSNVYEDIQDNMQVCS